MQGADDLGSNFEVVSRRNHNRKLVSNMAQRRESVPQQQMMDSIFEEYDLDRGRE